MFGGIFGGLGGGVYDQNYRAYPVAFIEKEGAERGDKIILPPSALQTLASMHVQYPMLFKVTNKREGKHSHCGVLEFVAQEGMCYMPQWIMDNLLLSVGDLVNLRNVSLPKGKYIKIQPHTKDFLDITNPKAVLETSLRSFTCLTAGDTFVIEYVGKLYHIDVLEVRPNDAISVVETDVEVDFAPPKDYVEPDYAAQAAQQAAEASAAAAAAAGPSGSAGNAAAAKQDGAAAAEAEPEEETFLAFGGSGNRLDGKAAPSREAVPVPLSALGRSRPALAAKADASEAGDNPSAPAASSRSVTGKSGKVVFGESGGAAGGAAPGGIAGNRLAQRLSKKKDGPAGAPKPAPPQPDKKPEEDKWGGFKGSGRSLKD